MGCSGRSIPGVVAKPDYWGFHARWLRIKSAHICTQLRAERQLAALSGNQATRNVGTSRYAVRLRVKAALDRSQSNFRDQG